ncbi:MAG: hypothetical protein U0232_03265 [Thermomicrobiales bacterium]
MPIRCKAHCWLTGRRFPAPVKKAMDGVPLGRITAIAAGGSYSLALDQEGQVWTWGSRIEANPALGNRGSRSFYPGA